MPLPQSPKKVSWWVYLLYPNVLVQPSFCVAATIRERMTDRNGCIAAFKEQYRKIGRDEEDKGIWQDRCHFSISDEVSLLSFFQTVVQPIFRGTPSRYTFCQRNCSSNELSLSDHWKNIFFAARCFIETIVGIWRDALAKEGAPSEDSSTFQQYDVTAQRHILMVQQLLPDLSYYTIVQRTVDVLWLQRTFVCGNRSSNVPSDTMDIRMQRFGTLLGSPSFLYHIVQYDASIRTLRIQQLTQILLSSSSTTDEDAVAMSAMELDAWVVVSPQSVSDHSQKHPSANTNRGLFLWLLSQLHALRQPRPVQNDFGLDLSHLTPPQRSLLDALIALLYQHMTTMYRIDFVVLLTILYPKDLVSNTTIMDRSVSDIQCLLGIEAMALWYIVNQRTALTMYPSVNGDSGKGLLDHPFFRDVLLSDEGRGELEEILRFIRAMWREAQSPTAYAPEYLSVMVFSFGLLLYSASSTAMLDMKEGTDTHSQEMQYWNSLNDAGREFITQSNSQYNPMQYLCRIMSMHVLSPASRMDIHDVLVDFIVLNVEDDDLDPSIPLLTRATSNESPLELSSSALLYAYIGREILISTIYLFPNSLAIPPSTTGKADDATTAFLETIGLLSSTMQSIFSNSPTLSQLFWSDWNLYLTDKENGRRPPSTNETPQSKALLDLHTATASVALCRLLDVTQQLAITTLVQLETPNGPVERHNDPTLLVRKLLPTLQIVSAIIYNSKMLENVFSEGIIPPSLIPTILNLLLVPFSTESTLAYQAQFVISLSMLSNIGKNSSDGRRLLRHALDGTDSNLASKTSLILTKGLVSNLLKIVVASGHRSADSDQMAFHAWNVLANVLDHDEGDTPVEWILSVTRELQILQDPKYHDLWHRWFLLSDSDATFNAPSVSILRVVDSVIGQLNKVAFSRDGCCSEFNVAAIISSIGTTVLSFLSMLTALSTFGCRLSRSANEDIEATSLHSTFTSALIMNSVSRLIQHLLPIAKFHRSEVVKAAALRTYNDCIYSLSSKGGVREAIAQHMINPFLLRLLNFIDVSVESKADATDEKDTFFPTRSSMNTLPEYFALLLESHLPHSSQPEMRGNLVDGSGKVAEEEKSTGSLFITALASIRLLNVWSDLMDDFDFKSNERASLSYLLGVVASAPTTRGRSHPFLTLTSCANELTFWSLLLRQMIILRPGCAIDSIFAIETFKILLSNAVYFRELNKDEAGSNWWFKDMANSTTFTVTMTSYWKRANAFLDKKNASKLEFNVIRHFLLFFEAMAHVTPHAAIAVLTTGGSEVLRSLLKTISEVATSLSGETEELNVGDSFSAFKLELATSFLLILFLLRRQDNRASTKSQRNEFKCIIEDDKLVLRSLSSCVFSYTQVQTAFLMDDHVHGRRRFNVFLRFVSAALDVVSLELSRAQESTSLNEEIVHAVGVALRSNMHGIAHTTKALTRLTSSLFQSYETFSKDLITKSSLLPIEVNGDQLFIVPRSNEFTSTCSNESSRKRIQKWVVAMNKATDRETDSWIDQFMVVDVEFLVATNQLSCMRSWTSFVHGLVLLLKKCQGVSPDSPLFQISRSSLLQNVAIEVLRNFHENLSLFELSRPQPSSSILRHIRLLMSKSLSGLLLICVSTKEMALASAQDEWLESLCRVRDILKLVSSYPDVADLFFETMSELLVTASVLVDSSLGRDAISSDLFGKKSQLESISFDIASMACQMLLALEQRAVRNATIVQCFSTCVLLLSSFMERCQIDTRDARDRCDTFALQLCDMFQQQYTIPTLLRQAQIYLNDDILYEPVSLVLGLLTKMASLGDATMLALLLDSAGTVFKPMCPLPISQNHERHSIWLAQLNLIGSCVWSARNNVDRSQPSIDRCRRVAELFLTDNQNALLGCLQFCSSVEFGANASRKHKFSIAVLREAKHIMAIVSGLYIWEAKDDVTREKSVLYQHFALQVTSLAVGLSTFLGASAMARDLFNALNDGEITDMMDQGADPMRHGPLYRVLSNGLQNAKHEAIRFASHFVLNCVQPISPENETARQVFSHHGEYAQNVNGTATTTELSSISELERECRSGITNLFAYQTELEAAECLIHVMKVLYAAHPASSSLLRVPADPPRRAIWSMVVPGTVIAYRDHGTAEPYLQMAKVLRCDSVHRQWLVQPMTDECRSTDDTVPPEGMVDEAQLVGWEDASRRVPILSFTGAPETSSDLEQLSPGPSLSMGHLILLLRWCCQFQKEMLLSADMLDDGRFTTIAARLAERVSLVLGLDLSLHGEMGRRPQFLWSDPSAISTGTPADRTNAMILADQILDLFGETNDFSIASSFAPSPPRQGRLQGLLSVDSWSSARRQLRSYLPHRTGAHRAPRPQGGVGPMNIAGGNDGGR